ncbi:MAG: DUF1643 domain-containing protein [Clostridia bacterium]|nr:DUF1643 domain-containing protein [Clostridia bacterium]
MSERNIKYPDFVDVENIKVENYGYDDEKFRFLLKVPFKTDSKNYLRVIMKNPSVANEQKCDMTMIKVCNATYKAGFDGVWIMNLFPYRATYAVDVYSKFYEADKALYEMAISTNKQIIKELCTDSEVIFAWGTNTIRKTKAFDMVYDQMANDVIEIIEHCAKGACSPCLDKSAKHPIHALRWWNTILEEKAETIEDVDDMKDEKHMVLHRNMFGPSAEVCNSNPKDLEIYCYKRNEICVPDCTGCEYFRESEMGNGIACEWEDFDGNFSYNESVIRNDEKVLEYDRVQYAKKCSCKEDVDKYMNWIINYEK